MPCTSCEQTDSNLRDGTQAPAVLTHSRKLPSQRTGKAKTVWEVGVQPQSIPVDQT